MCVCTVRVVAPSTACVPRLTCVHMYIRTGLGKLYAVIATGSSDICTVSFFNLHLFLYNCDIHSIAALWYIIGCCVHHSVATTCYMPNLMQTVKVQYIKDDASICRCIVVIAIKYKNYYVLQTE